MKHAEGYDLGFKEGSEKVFKEIDEMWKYMETRAMNTKQRLIHLKFQIEALRRRWGEL